MEYTEFKELVGQTLKSIKVVDDERVVMELTNGDEYELYHRQDCCESVNVEDVVGDLQDLIGEELLQAEESSSEETPEGIKREYTPESQTWTFYKMATVKGSVTIRFFGESNGYYSERVDFRKVGGNHAY